MASLEWRIVQQAIQECRRCEIEHVPYLRVPHGEKRRPPSEPTRPVRIYFVSVAPPWGGSYFWDEKTPDAVREGLFTSVSRSFHRKITKCSELLDAHFFLTPAVKCPSTKNSKDRQPSGSAIRYCKHFLRDELLAAEPQRILALGRKPFKSLCEIFDLDAPQEVAEFRKCVWWIRLGALEIPLSGTYFPGNNRHKGFPYVAQDIEKLLQLNPRLYTD